MISSRGWVLADLREPGNAAVISVDGVSRDRSSLSRALAKHLGGRRSQTAAEQIDVLAHGDQRNASFVVEGLRCYLVPGPGNETHAAWIRIDSTSDNPPYAKSFAWDRTSLDFRMPSDSARIAASDGGHTAPYRISPPEAFQFTDVDDTMGCIQFLLNPELGHWAGGATLHPPTGPRHVWFDLLTIGTATVGIVFGVEEVVKTRLETAALSALGRFTQAHLAILDGTRMRIVRWFTEPLADIAWQSATEKRYAVHPEDRAATEDLARQLVTGAAKQVVLPRLRLRHVDGGWVVVEAAGELVPTAGAPILLAKFTPIDRIYDTEVD